MKKPTANNPTFDWEEALTLTKQGDERMKEKFFAELRVYLLTRVGWLYGLDETEREDIVEEVLYRIVVKLPEITDHPRGYASGVLRNVFGDYLKKEKPDWKSSKEDQSEDYAHHKLDTKARRLDSTRLSPKDELYVEDWLEDLNSRIYDDWLVQADRLSKFMSYIHRLKLFCRLYVRAFLDEREKELETVFRSLYPTHSKSDFYVQLSRCRASFAKIRLELER